MLISKFILVGAAANGPDAYIAWQVVLTIGVLVAIGANVVAVLSFRRVQKREVKMDHGLASKEEFDRHTAWDVSEHEKFWSKIGGVERGGSQRLENKVDALRAERSQETTELRKEVTKVAERVSALDALNIVQNQRLTEISAKLDRVIENKRHP